MSIDGGNPVQLTYATAAISPSISADGKWIACAYRASSKSGWVIAVLPFAGGKLPKLFLAPRNTQYSRENWTPDGRAIAYLVQKGGVSNIVEQPIGGGSPIQLTHFDSGHIFQYAISRDGQLALARGTQSSDVVLIRNFQ